MNWSALVTLLVGTAVLAALLAANDLAEILRLLAGMSWGILAVVALRLPQILASAFGWAPLIEDAARPPWPVLFRLRWIRDAVNALLPVAQVGGDVVRAQLLVRRGVRGVTATASVAVDLAAEMAAQVAFSAIGLTVLWYVPHRGPVGWAVAACAVLGAMAGSFLAAQRWGLFRLVERLLPRLARQGQAAATGLHEAVVRLYGAPRRLWISGAAHLASWLFGVLETWAALRLLGIEAGLAEAVVIESLGQLARSLGFMVPGAIGVQEGGFVLACGLFGIPPEQALAFALIRRIRDILLGLPGIIAWRWDAAAVPHRTLTDPRPR
ncbi:lysylphosphatidylglycerol synthase domain-containing protein [Belnapia rosea]|uniref:Putative membrane protein n=1 Tax=Belnapia rosea TaxID=938405 RepID=A0A1G6STS1_9PROT|nr:lysylphosphatidylglycerol synthase domain-containing protein [Belnapia rosea]SDD20179.1 putative membrane protein [Belnapia rosea]